MEAIDAVQHLNIRLDYTAAALAEDIIMVQHRFLPDFVLSHGNGCGRRFHEFLTDVNVVMLTRVPEASHGPASELLRSLVAGVGCLGYLRIRGFDIRSLDGKCATYNGPHVIYGGQVLMTICDNGGIIRRLFGVTEDDHIFVVRADRHVIDAGRINEVEQLSKRLSLVEAPPAHGTARSTPGLQHVGRRRPDR